jgi:PleD family two-component response regulator
MIIINLATSSAEYFETVERIRQDSRLVDIPVIAITDGLDEDEKDRASNLGINDFATRPVTADTFKALLDRHLEDNTAQDHS